MHAMCAPAFRICSKRPLCPVCRRRTRTRGTVAWGFCFCWPPFVGTPTIGDSGRMESDRTAMRSSTLSSSEARDGLKRLKMIANFHHFFFGRGCL